METPSVDTDYGSEVYEFKIDLIVWKLVLASTFV